MADQNGAYIVAAYTLTWLVVLGYTIGVLRALRRARHAYKRTAAAEESR